MKKKEVPESVRILQEEFAKIELKPVQTKAGEHLRKHGVKFEKNTIYGVCKR